MRVNLDSMYHMCRAFLPGMVHAGRGAIVNTGSQWGTYPAPGHISYNVSKTAHASAGVRGAGGDLHGLTLTATRLHARHAPKPRLLVRACTR